MDSDVQRCDLQKQDLVAEVLRTSGKVILAARGHSMLPALWPGDLLTIESTSFEQVCPGDVVLYRRWRRFFIHRVLRKSCGTGSDRLSLVTRGDSMSRFDAEVLPEELLGKVVSIEGASGCVPVPECTKFRRILGLALGSGDRLRNLVLRWHGWRRRTLTKSEANAELIRSRQTLSSR